jgi:hypothetical protein
MTLLRALADAGDRSLALRVLDTERGDIVALAAGVASFGPRC